MPSQSRIDTNEHEFKSGGAAEDFSSDYAVILQRVYNSRCCVVGSDPQRLQNSLVSDHYIPNTRALLFERNGASPTTAGGPLLDPHFTDSYKTDTKMVHQQARKDLEEENKILPAKVRQIRGG